VTVPSPSPGRSNCLIPPRRHNGDEQSFQLLALSEDGFNQQPATVVAALARAVARDHLLVAATRRPQAS
jgi:hypothetical protein